LFLGNFDPALTHSETTAFYDGYLPDPLGASDPTLLVAVERAMRAKQNLTPVSGLVHSFKRSLRRRVAVWRLWALVHVMVEFQLCDIFDVLA
jgi:hypothetical protein